MHEALSHFPDLNLISQMELGSDDFTLERMLELVAALGHPERSYRIIHVAGTNGKGSISALCAAALQAQGYKAGLYTSPHYMLPRQGIQIDGQVISDQETEDLIGRMSEYLENLPGVTRFEVMTALAFFHFAESKVEVAVIEAGLGGLLDATNVILPAVSVITPIDREHVSILGDSLEDIAAHKAGVIKPGIPVVISPQPQKAQRVFHEKAKEMGAPLVQIGRDYLFERVSYGIEGQDVAIWQADQPESRTKVRIQLLGEHQAQNAAVAFAALKTMERSGLLVSERAIQNGFAGARWPGRFELLQSEPPIVLDAAHTPAAAHAMNQSLEDHFPEMHIVALIGISGDKDIAGLLKPLQDRFVHVIATQSPHPRAMPAEKLATILVELGYSAISIPDTEEAILAAIELAGDRKLLIIFGSVFLTERVGVLWNQQIKKS